MATIAESSGVARSAKARRASATKALILSAAEIEFADKGYAGASMRAVARACGVELALVQYHFQDKMGLWRAVLESVVGGYLASFADLRGVSEVRPAGEIIALFLEDIIRHAASHPQFVGILSHARLRRSADSDAMQAQLKPGVLYIIEQIREAQRDGVMAPGEPGLIFYLMIGAALRIFMYAADAPVMANLSIEDSETLDRHIYACVRLFLPTIELSPEVGWRMGQASNMAEAAPRPLAPTAAATPAGGGPDAASAFVLLSRAGALSRAHLEQELTQLGLTQGQMTALLHIAQEGRVSAAALARLLSVKAQTAAFFVKGLEDAGLIRKSADPASKRSLHLGLTPQGAAIMTRIHDCLARVDQLVLGSLPFEARADFKRSLGRIVAP